MGRLREQNSRWGPDNGLRVREHHHDQPNRKQPEGPQQYSFPPT